MSYSTKPKSERSGEDLLKSYLHEVMIINSEVPMEEEEEASFQSDSYFITSKEVFLKSLHIGLKS